MKKEKSIFNNNTLIATSKGIIGIIGAGNFTKMTLLPTLKKLDCFTNIYIILTQPNLSYDWSFLAFSCNGC